MPDPAKLRLLVVDDDASMVHLVRRLLTAAGYEHITVVSSGAEALAASGEADIILLDYQLPDGTGIELLPR
ncbi:MAG: response regulator, partial [Gemmatimonadales bacterium]